MMNKKTLRVAAWIEQPNLGDRFTELWLKKQGYEVEVTDQWEDANFVGVGSLLEQVQGHHVTVWGTGRTYDPRETGPINISAATVLALRGPLSALGSYGARAAVNLRKGFVMGDPGLLAADLIEGLPTYASVDGPVYVPHWTMYEAVKEQYGEDRTVNLLGDPFEALREIQAADYIVSSSLHGIIFADAFGVEREWEYLDSIPGKGFKFRDYGALVGRFQPGDSVKVADSIISGIQTELREVFQRWAMNAVQ